MRLLILVLLVAVFAVSALAGNNPLVSVRIEFEESSGWPGHRIQPEPGTSIHARICCDYNDGGITVVSFRLNDFMSEYPGVFSSWSFESLLPGGLAIGDPLVGVTVASTECMMTDPVYVAELTLEYEGGDACIQVLDHPEYPRWVCDCQDPGQFDLYREVLSGVVGGDDMWCPGDPWEEDVRCEPQGEGNPYHPVRYWYKASTGYGWYGLVQSFRVRVYDPDPDNYTNWAVPYAGSEDEWIFGLEFDDETTWAVWRSNGTPLLFGNYVFAFDNPNLASWGDWNLNGVSSAANPWKPDGYGGRVHVPTAATPVEAQSWGKLKALYR